MESRLWSYDNKSEYLGKTDFNEWLSLKVFKIKLNMLKIKHLKVIYGIIGSLKQIFLLLSNEDL